jgi:hypothetical protein
MDTLHVSGGDIKAALATSNSQGSVVVGDGLRGDNYTGIFRSEDLTGGSNAFLSLGGYDGIIFFASYDPLDWQTERMRIVAGTGFIGIGTDTPASLLHISSGSVTVDGTDAGLTVTGGSVTMTSGGHDIILSTASTPGTGALKIVGTTGAVQISTGVVFLGIPAPTSAANQGILYYDSTRNAFYVSQNGGAAVPIVDPPGNWTCTVRNGSFMGSTTGLQDISAACSGNEKVFAGGCEVTVGNASSQTYCGLKQSGQGWEFKVSFTGGVTTINVWANCCQ